jgi:hypothetical protein
MQDANELDSVNDGLTEALASIPADTTADDGGDNGQATDDAGQPRDEQGRFAAKAADEAKTEEKPAPKAGDDDEGEGGRVPAWRLREIREERDAIRREQEAERRELEALRRERAAFLQQQQQRQQRQRPDLYGNPDEVYDYFEQTASQQAKSVEEMFRDWKINSTFEEQHEQHGEAFEKAMNAFTGAAGMGGSKNMPLFQSVVNAVNPGRELMRWHRRQEAMSTVGDDLDGFVKRKQDEWLKDPEVRKRILAEMNAEARGGNGGRSSDNVTDLPSVNRAPGGGGRQQLGDLGGTDKEIFDSLTRKRSA